MVSILLAGIEPSCPRERTRLLPQLLTRTGILNRPCRVAGFTSERWPASARNGGRLHVGIPGRLRSEFAVFTVATQPSLFAQKAADGLSALSQYQAANSAPDPSKQYHAHLQKLDATGWEVVSSDFFQPTPPSS
jgi:hypothetical protein